MVKGSKTVGGGDFRLPKNGMDEWQLKANEMMANIPEHPHPRWGLFPKRTPVYLMFCSAAITAFGMHPTLWSGIFFIINWIFLYLIMFTARHERR